MGSPDDVGWRLAVLETAEAVRNIVADYARAADDKDLDALAEVFSSHVVLTAPGRRWQGWDAVRGFYESAFEAEPDPRRHFITNVRVLDPTPDGATCTSYFLFTTLEPGGATIGWGRYHDTCEWVDGRMRIVAKDITVAHRGPLGAE